MTSICNSGGAEGADSLFGKCAHEIDHVVRHYAFPGMKSTCSKLIVLEIDELLEADQYIELANETLHRRFPSNNPYINNLLRRNYWQIRDTRAVFAVAFIR